jgi:peptidoglycan/xylan/chitin deacetylase (PgdA/CDA1 family)
VGGMSLTRRELLALSAAAAAGGLAGCSRGPGQPAANGSAKGSGSPASTVPSPTASTAQSPSTSPTPSGSATRRGPAAEVGHGPRTSSAVALTFHGAGSAATARGVLGELRRAQVHATVLAVGTWLDAEPAMARRVLDAGHDLGNHTQHHLPMRGLAAPTAFREVHDCAALLQRLTGSPGRWFRASGTQHTTARIRAAAGRAGYAQCLSYDVDSLDWTDPAPDAVVRAVLTHARGGSIISLHLGHAVTVRALPAVLDGLQQRGLRAGSVSELFA